MGLRPLGHDISTSEFCPPSIPFWRYKKITSSIVEKPRCFGPFKHASLRSSLEIDLGHEIHALLWTGVWFELRGQMLMHAEVRFQVRFLTHPHGCIIPRTACTPVFSLSTAKKVIVDCMNIICLSFFALRLMIAASLLEHPHPMHRSMVAAPQHTLSTAAHTRSPLIKAALQGQDYMYPFGVIGVAPRYIPSRAVFELAGIRLIAATDARMN